MRKLSEAENRTAAAAAACKTAFQLFAKTRTEADIRLEVPDLPRREENIKFTRLRVLTVLPAFLPLSAFCFCYAIGHLQKPSAVKPYPHIPFISSVISYQPQSGIATIIVYLSATMFLVLTIVRYLLIKAFDRPDLRRWNRASLVCGLAAVFGMLWVPAFDVKIQEMLHFVGTFVFIVATTTYFTLYTITARKLINGKRTALCRLRLVLTFLLWITKLITMIFLLPPLRKFNEAGYSVAPIAEWMWFCLLIAFCCTLIPDFKFVALVITVRPMPEASLSHYSKDSDISIVYKTAAPCSRSPSVVFDPEDILPFSNNLPKLGTSDH